MGKDLKGKDLGTGFTQRNDGRYEAKITINRKRYTWYDKKLSELKKRVKKEKFDIEHNLINAVAHDMSMLTLDQWFEVWIKEYKSKTVKPSSLVTYHTTYNVNIKPHIGDMLIKDIKSLHIQRLVNKLYEENGLSIRTIRTSVCARLSDLLKTAYDNDIISSNPYRGINFPREDEFKKKRVLTLYEQELFVEALKNNHYECLCMLALTTGARIGEITGLKWSDIDFDNKFIYIRRTLIYKKLIGKEKTEFSFQTPKTLTSKRKIKLLDDMVDMLEKHKCKQQEQILANKKSYGKLGEDFNDLVFMTNQHMPIDETGFSSRLDTIVRKINKKLKEEKSTFVFKAITPHALRRTFATRAFENGMKELSVKRTLGHNSINMTEYYTHITDELNGEEIQKIQSMFKVS